MNIEVINSNHNHCMDIRLKNNDLQIGIECKYKKSISRDDLDKFKKDKLTNNFVGGIFISTCSI